MSRTISELEQLIYTAKPAEELGDDIEFAYSQTHSNTQVRGRAAVLMSMRWRRENLELFEQYSDEAYQIALTLEDKYVLADALYFKSLDALGKSDLKLANQLHNETLQTAKEARHYYREAFSLHMLGNLAVRYGSFEDAVTYFGQAQKIAEDRGFLRLQIYVLQGLAEVTLTSQELSLARNYALKAIIVAEELGSTADLLMCNIRLATIELSLKNYDLVLRVVEEVAPQVPKKNRQLHCTIETLYGVVYSEQGEYPSAESHYKAAIELSDYPNGDRIRSSLHTHFSELYKKQSNYDAAIVEAQKALDAANLSEDVYQRKSALNLLQQCYRAQGNILEAYKYLEEYNALVSSSDQALLKNRLEYHAVRNELEVERSRSEEGRRQSEMLRIELKQRERELMEKTRHLIKQTEAVTQFRGELQAIIKRSPVTDPLVHEIKSRLKSLPESELSWQDFDEQFKLVHPDFSTKLATEYPSLTPMERKICALLRLDLSSPEIAKLLFLSERNIQNHRYRLRKKLALGSDENMHTFLAKI